MASNIVSIKKLQKAINVNCPFKILYTTAQFYSMDCDLPITKYCIRKVLMNYETRRAESVEVFSTYSQLCIVMFLRDLWFVWQGKELPTNNEKWESIKKREHITLETYKDVIRT